MRKSKRPSATKRRRSGVKTRAKVKRAKSVVAPVECTESKQATVLALLSRPGGVTIDSQEADQQEDREARNGG